MGTTIQATEYIGAAEPIPFPTPVALPNGEQDQLPRDLAETLNETVAAIKRYVHFASEEQAWAVTLWIAQSHILDNFDTCARLAIRAPSKMSGKTRLMEVLRELVYKGWHIVGPSAAVLFRNVEKNHPTILLDEADRFFERRAEDTADVLQFLNTGHARGSTVPRIVGPKLDVHDFPAFSAVAIAGIGTDWPDTVLDRSVVINMERKRSTEKIERLRREAKAGLRDLGARLAASLVCVETFTVDDLPDELSDRAQDGWEALLAIARTAGPEWEARARQAAIALSSQGAEVGEERVEMLALRDLRIIFARNEDPRWLASELLVFGLLGIAESPWSAEPRPLTQNTLARLMRTFGIRSQQDTKGGHRGYYLVDILRHWDRLGTGDQPLTDVEPGPVQNAWTPPIQEGWLDDIAQ